MLHRSGRILIATGAALAITGVLLTTLGRDGVLERQDAPPGGLSDLVGDFVGGLSRDQEYQPPSAQQRRIGVRALIALVEDRQSAGGVGEAGLSSLGFTVRDDVDSATGRPFTVVTDEHANASSGSARSWGMFVIDRSAPPALVVGVPHPRSDLRTEELGVDLFRRIPGSIMLIAGAHRRAADAEADVAHQQNSLFHAFSAAFSGRGLGQVQLHGFDDRSLPGVDIVVSAGATRAGGSVRRLAARLDHDDWVICRAWEGHCTGLEGRTNVQGKAAAEHGAVFVHLELSRSIREDRAARERVLAALAEAGLAGS
ncbi:hypothetical protein [Amycolatopsis palatopharyngis]|uniref:hypothetical protein n=1 Tax=Amycolatopsis palatopharyngis TaxID=187982 RepID=UPI001B87E721|nr:hypothetical protein [Amycolatopsis palatopharyngis]